MSEKSIAITVSATDEDTDASMDFDANVDFMFTENVYFTVRAGDTILQQFYVPNGEARAMAEFILREAGT